MSDRDLLMIPGPIEFEPEVLGALGAKTRSHVDPRFIEVFGRALGRFRQVCLTTRAQPFVVAGSGTLAMEMAAANLVEPGDAALVVSTGFFGERMAKILERHGAEATVLRAPVGGCPSPDEVEQALASRRYKVLALTHVDTSTGVLAPMKALLDRANAHGALSIVDGVCATAGEEFRQDEWNADVYLTASQKAVGVPPGLALLSVSPRAMEAWRARKSPVRAYYADFAEWLPIMEAYEARRPSYFATPAVNLIHALDVSLGQLLDEGMDARFARHQRIARAFRAAWSTLELKPVPVDPALVANTLSAVYLPEGVDLQLVARTKQEGVVIAGGLHPEIRTRSFRVGHMGAVRPNDLLATVGAVARALKASGHPCNPAGAVAAAQDALG